METGNPIRPISQMQKPSLRRLRLSFESSNTNRGRLCVIRVTQHKVSNCAGKSEETRSPPFLSSKCLSGRRKQQAFNRLQLCPTSTHRVARR